MAPGVTCCFLVFMIVMAFRFRRGGDEVQARNNPQTNNMLRMASSTQNTGKR